MQPIDFTIVSGDISKFEADVAVFKYSNFFFGVSGVVLNRLMSKGINPHQFEVAPGEMAYVASEGGITAKHVLFVGTVPLDQLNYLRIREMSYNALSGLAQSAPETQHIAMVVHGNRYGLDTVESVQAQLGGILDALAAGVVPRDLRRISIVEMRMSLIETMQVALDEVLGAAEYATPLDGEWGYRIEMTRETLDTMAGEPESEPPDAIQQAGAASDAKPHIFVAMPFDEQYDDLFTYGIEAPVHKAGFLCERIDQQVFEGDIFERIKQRIAGASAVVAVLTGANPNVYLELGYAWGIGRPTILLVDNVDELRFDVRGQRALIYTKIRDAEKTLTDEITALMRNKVIVG